MAYRLRTNTMKRSRDRTRKHKKAPAQSTATAKYGSVSGDEEADYAAALANIKRLDAKPGESVGAAAVLTGAPYDAEGAAEGPILVMLHTAGGALSRLQDALARFTKIFRGGAERTRQEQTEEERRAEAAVKTELGHAVGSEYVKYGLDGNADVCSTGAHKRPSPYFRQGEGGMDKGQFIARLQNQTPASGRHPRGEPPCATAEEAEVLLECAVVSTHEKDKKGHEFNLTFIHPEGAPRKHCQSCRVVRDEWVKFKQPGAPMYEHYEEAVRLVQRSAHMRR